ncbi:hypothetical protein Q766_02855 [Flavobacterium subsaxonicum WB 4.1-42 = DSM 21790]|uniref:Uncharacterized protein n=2 Tax=Flavobacterium TaxID=237 RepID=A0A0A2MUB1_9FLAO|nr:hypothetical protein Q766_02855 [Flavobacterium subsaxonicum WB 4.1-42 = DSM 21790]
MLNGEKREGKVVSVKDDAIKFVYKGETLEYEFKKSQINKIEFASGRTEVVNNSVGLAAAPTSTAAERKGRIAVLPYTFITNETALNPEAMGKQLQTDTYNAVKANTSSLQLQDPITTNSLLARQGLTHANLNTKTPQEMATLLGVEYVVYGIANVTNKGTSTYGSGSTTYNGKETEKKEGRKETTKASGTTYSSNNATVLTNYDTKIDLSFFNDQGTSIYSESRKAFGSGADAYHATINYLIKRCPFGTKAKN